MAGLRFGLLCAASFCLLPVSAWVRAAAAVPGDVVKSAGNLTKGGKVGIYATLLQVINPSLGNMQLLLECCGEAQGLAQEAANMLNSNQYTSPIEDNLKKDFVGDGKCGAPGPLKTLFEEGKEECSYLYDFETKDYKKYSFSAFCIPDDVISQMADTKGVPMGYTVVNQVLNRNAGELVYAAEGYLSFCYDGMNSVNEANNTFELFKPTYVELFGQKYDTGYMEAKGFPGLGRLNIFDMMERSAPAPFLGTLFVYKNNFWSKSQSATNVTHFDMKQFLAQKEAAKPTPAEYQKEVNKGIAATSKDLAPFQNKNLTDAEKAQLTQTMAAKESKTVAERLIEKIKQSQAEAKERKEKMDGFIKMLGFTERTDDNQPQIELPPQGKKQLPMLSSINMAEMMKRASVESPEGPLGDLPPEAAAAMPEAAVAALEATPAAAAAPAGKAAPPVPEAAEAGGYGGSYSGEGHAKDLGDVYGPFVGAPELKKVPKPPAVPAPVAPPAAPAPKAAPAPEAPAADKAAEAGGYGGSYSGEGHAKDLGDVYGPFVGAPELKKVPKPPAVPAPVAAPAAPAAPAAKEAPEAPKPTDEMAASLKEASEEGNHHLHNIVGAMKILGDVPEPATVPASPAAEPGTAPEPVVLPDFPAGPPAAPVVKEPPAPVVKAVEKPTDDMAATLKKAGKDGNHHLHNMVDAMKTSGAVPEAADVPEPAPAPVPELPPKKVPAVLEEIEEEEEQPKVEAKAHASHLQELLTKTHVHQLRSPTLAKVVHAASKMKETVV